MKSDRQIVMEKPNVRGPSPSRKAHLALRQKLNRKDKPPPPLLESIREPARKPRPKIKPS